MSDAPGPTRTLMYMGTEVEYEKYIPRATHSVWLDLDGIANDGRRLLDIIDAAEKHKRECLYTVKMGKTRGRPGMIWVFEATEGEPSTLFPSTGRPIGRWQNEEDCTVWQAKEDTVRKEIALGSKAAKEMEENLPKEALKPIREVYWGLTTRQRGIFLAQVMAYITGGSGSGKD